MKGILRFALGALCALTIAGVYAQPPGLAGLVWQDTQIEFDLNAGNLVTTGALSTTIAIGNQAPVCLTKAPNTLNINLDLSALVGHSRIAHDYSNRHGACWRQPNPVDDGTCGHQLVSARTGHRLAC
jgi:hypothetical protein